MQRLKPETLKQFGNNQLRITDLGLLVEDARTNYFIKASQDFPRQRDLFAQPIKLLFPSGFTAPDGTTTACKIIPEATKYIFSHYNFYASASGAHLFLTPLRGQYMPRRTAINGWKPTYRTV